MSLIPVLLGTMTFGEEGKDMVRVHDLKEAQKILDIFKSHGHNELDTVRKRPRAPVRMLSC